MNRKYIPKVGDTVKLKAFWMYHEVLKPTEQVTVWTPEAKVLSNEPRAWARLLVEEAHSHGCYVTHINRSATAFGKPWQGWVFNRDIDPPIGWKPVYTMICKDIATAEMVVNAWFQRGICVWQDHNLSMHMGQAFTPADKTQSPGWKYTGNPVEIIPPELCASCFTVQWEESKELAWNEDKNERKKEVAKLRSEGWTCEYHNHGWDRYWTAYRTHMYRETE